MRTTLIIAIIFAGLLSCAYSAPPSNAVLQELQSVLAQNSPTEEPSEEPAKVMELLCRVVGEKTIDVNGDNGRVRAQGWGWVKPVLRGAYRGGKAAGWWANQERADAQQQQKAEVVGLTCTPVETQPNGQVTFLMFE